MCSSEIAYGLYWVAYFDLLGFRKKVERDQLGFVLQDYHEVLAAIKKETRRDVRTRGFSDTFLFYMLDDSKESFLEINNACRSFFHRMILKEIPLRGSLTVGELYVESDDVLIGPALVEAYDYAERQDWLGFVLIPNAREQLKRYDVDGKAVYDLLCEHWYRDYDVPVKSGRGPESRETESLPACTMNLKRFLHGNQYLDEAQHIGDALEDIEPKGTKEDAEVAPKESRRI
jgi:hypothetical protein